MKTKLITTLILIILLIGCRNYNSQEYINEENQAINDIIPEMTNYDEMVKMNNYDTSRLKLYIISCLDTSIYPFFGRNSMKTIKSSEIKSIETLFIT